MELKAREIGELMQNATKKSFIPTTIAKIIRPDLEFRLFDVPITGSTSGLSFVVWWLPQTPLDVGDDDQQIEDKVDEHGVLYQTVHFDRPCEYQNQQSLRQHSNVSHQ